MLDERKTSILRAVVEEYIRTAQPVGSSHVVNAPGVNVSSATVRNEMAGLENEGYLTQPHTSAGRIPTEKGYRYFVDALNQPVLDRASSQQVRAFFDRTHGEIEQMLADTTRLLSGLTDYAAVVVAPGRDATQVLSVQVVGLGTRTALFVAVLADGSVEKRTIELSEEAGEEVLDRARQHLSEHLVGRPLTGLPEVPASHDPAVEAVVGSIREARIEEPADDHVFVGGAARMVAAFEAVETIRAVLSILEEQLVVVSLLRDVVSRGMNVAIGSETGIQPLSECALVVAPYTVDGEKVGTVGVLGPTRMNYPQALAAVAVVGQRLGHRLSEG